MTNQCMKKSLFTKQWKIQAPEKNYCNSPKICYYTVMRPSCIWNCKQCWPWSFRNSLIWVYTVWAASTEFGTYRLCEQQRFRRACASRQNLCCSLLQAVNQKEPSDRKPDPWPLWTAGHAQLKFVMTGNARIHKFAWHTTFIQTCLSKN